MGHLIEVHRNRAFRRRRRLQAGWRRLVNEETPINERLDMVLAVEAGAPDMIALDAFFYDFWRTTLKERR